MKKLNLVILFVLVTVIASAQQTNGLFRYQSHTVYLEEKEKAEDEGAISGFQKRQGLLVNANMPYEQLFICHGDTLYSEKVYEGIAYPYKCIVQLKDEAYSYNSQTGRKSDYRYSRPLLPETHFKRGFKKSKELKGKKYQCYEGENNFVKIHIWIEKDGALIHGDQFYSGFVFKNKLILRQEIYYKMRKLKRIRQLFEIDKNIRPNCAQKIAWVENRSDKNKMYAPIQANENTNLEPIKVGGTAPDIYYRRSPDFEKVALHTFKGNGKYTLVEFWGTWCGPCLAATPKLKVFYEEYKSKLDILSVNWRDNRSSYVKQMIELKQMNWNHAFGTDKFLKIMNPPLRYPTMVLLDDKMKVLLIGNPHVDMDKLRQLVN